MRKSTKIAAALAALLGAGTIAIPVGVVGASTPEVLYVSPTGVNTNSDHSCTTAKYSSIQAAVGAATWGSTIHVCRGTYDASLTIPASKHNLKIVGASGSVVEPSSPASSVTDVEGGAPIIPIVQVAPGAVGTHISGLNISGSAIEGGINGCADQLVGVLVQATSGHSASGALSGLTVTDTTPTNQGCGSGLGIDVETGPSSSASMTISHDNVSSYGKNGITCDGLGVSCTISNNTITTAPTPLDGQNGVQVGFGAHGSVTDNDISGNVWTEFSPPTSDPNPEPQSDFAAGVLLYGAGINYAGVTTRSTSVTGNSLLGNQIGVEVVDSEATVSYNNINETSPGLVDSIGIFGVGCDAYCLYFTDHPGGATLDTVASSSQAITVEHNLVNFTSTPAGSYGIWLGDASWTGVPSEYSGPAGHEVPTRSNNTIRNVAHGAVTGAGA